jgi:hypothetical protein
MDALLERLFDLRALQANCPADQRSQYEAEIASILAQINKG